VQAVGPNGLIISDVWTHLIPAAGKRIVWAPEFMVFHAGRRDLMFAAAAVWVRPIRFARGPGGHAPVLEVSRLARDAGVRRLAFVIGRPTIRAFDGSM